ncbi:MAG: immunoglobulin-like domain-containing protein [Anaerofustis sp.]
MIRCKHCGKETETGLILCPYCSAYLEDDDAVIEKILPDPLQLPPDTEEEGPLIGFPTIREGAIPASEKPLIYEIDARNDDPTEQEVRDIMSVINHEDEEEKQKRHGLLFYAAAIFVLSLLWIGIYRFVFYSPLIAPTETLEASAGIDPATLVTLRDNQQDHYTFMLKQSDLQSNIPGTYRVVYSLTNSASHKTKDVAFRFTVVDTTAPVIMVSKSVQIAQGDTFELSDFVTVSDNSLPLSAQDIHVGGTVDTQTVGTYPLTLSLTDASGNTTIMNITVAVIQRTQQDIFFDLIYGTWKHGNQIIIIGTKDGAYSLQIDNKIGTLTYDTLSDSGDSAVFIWEWTDADNTQANANKSKLTINASEATNGMLSVNLSDGNGYRSYRKMQDTEN